MLTVQSSSRGPSASFEAKSKPGVKIFVGRIEREGILASYGVADAGKSGVVDVGSK